MFQFSNVDSLSLLDPTSVECDGMPPSSTAGLQL